MKHATLCLPITESEVLLGMKKKDFGVGKWNGFGSKVKDGETPEQATIRELKEECGLDASEEHLEKVAVLLFYFNKKPVFFMHTYVLKDWAGEPFESEEMKPKWHRLDRVPYEEMWAADRFWMEDVVKGKKVAAHVHFRTSSTPGLSDEEFDRFETDSKLWDFK
ncbi:MAG: 8-oxo-dGTP diphosphatase [Candidatus Pacebacteria bacterium]|jgi:8-oxo-dGTP diphosphatase|nr:DNA mismatch repair protein MutT [bacterium]MDP6527281.1 8-oxo-dGTP diphosphatase [Candidatus Paceibacterota bacterium]MDP6659681.1 8-oxo-dGTP diphosphatase [Candidatus Paceibacterota bacterium]|tara:strand:- start:20873 stop:21364 length:492 start_codon:yes stop_codon:yes gene_type:complete